jgi:hypothetical protein
MFIKPCKIHILDDIETDIKTVFIVDKNNNRKPIGNFELLDQLWEYVKTIAREFDLSLYDIVFEDNSVDWFEIISNYAFHQLDKE